MAIGYTHDSVYHTIQFVDPQTGAHTNTQEGLWHHVKKQMVGLSKHWMLGKHSSPIHLLLKFASEDDQGWVSSLV